MSGRRHLQLAAAPPAFLALGLEVAQDVQQVTPADDTGRMIAIVIGALLGLALLLSVLTVWYWRRTDPKRRTVPARGTPITVERAVPSGAEPGPRPTPPTKPAAAAPPATAPRSGAASQGDGGISAEEWLRLTGPSEQSRER